MTATKILVFASLAMANAFTPALMERPKTSLQAMSFDPNVLGKSELPGNFGFDPLHLSQTQEQLVTYRKAEMKHARLAILVSVTHLYLIISWYELS